MKKINVTLFVIVILCGFCVGGCSVNPSEIESEYAKNFAKKIAYVKDERTGLCFAMVASRKTGNTDQNGLGLACVPCEAVQHLLAK